MRSKAAQPVKMTAGWLENLGNAGRLPIQIMIKNMNLAQDEVERFQALNTKFSDMDYKAAMNAAVQYATVAAPYCHAKIMPTPANGAGGDMEAMLEALRAVLMGAAKVITPVTQQDAPSITIEQQQVTSQERQGYSNPYV